MGFLTKIFTKKIKQPEKNEWMSIVNNITGGLERVRTVWFIDCKFTIASLHECTIINKELSGNAVIYAKTFQLYNACMFIIQKQYISPSDVREFVDMLFYKVCAGNEISATEYQNELSKFKSDAGRQAYMFASDISAHLTGNKDPVCSMAIIPSLVRFVGETNMIIANSFGDNKTSAKIASKLGE